MKIFEYAVIYHPLATKEQQDRAEKPKSVLIVDVKRILANNDKEATILASRDIPEDYTNKLDLVEIAIRPF